jgi:glycosyltransferase involved in cell wall biosynthesis
MKILWQAYDRADYTGGPIINTIRILPEFKRKGYEVIAIIGHNGTGHPNADNLQQNGIKCITYRIPKYSEDHTKIFLKALKKCQPDIFVSNISVQAGFAGRWAQQWGIPVIHTHRSNDPLNCGTAEFFFAGSPEWRLTGLVCVNSYLLDKVKKLNSKGFISRVIPSGVPIPNLINQPENVKHLKIVYSGRLVQKQKRVDDLLSSFISTAQMLDNVSFTVIGSGEYRYFEQLKNRVINSGMRHRIKFPGRLLAEEYINELRKHHIIALFSDYEGIPGSIMDGMACGLVPVVLKTNGINELIKDHFNGIIIRDRKDDLKKAIRDLSQNRGLYKKLSYNARDTIVNHFSLDKTVSHWDELFKEVLSISYVRKPMIFPDHINLPNENHLLIQHRIKPTLIRRIFNHIKQYKYAK